MVCQHRRASLDLNGKKQQQPQGPAHRDTLTQDTDEGRAENALQLGGWQNERDH